MRLYAESSAVLAWLLGEEEGEEVRQLLIGSEEIFTSVLTLVETDRTLIRAQVVETLKPVEVAERRRVLARASRRWHLVNLVEEILDRARRPFPGEPVRTLDALHLASALAVRTSIPELAVLSLDHRIRSVCMDLGFEVLPGANG